MTDREFLNLLIQHIETTVPYVDATLGTHIRAPGKPDWIEVHAGRAISSQSQLRGLRELAKRPPMTPSEEGRVEGEAAGNLVRLLQLRGDEITELRKELYALKKYTAMQATIFPAGTRGRSLVQPAALPVVAKSGTKLKKLREQLGLSQKQLGERLGLARTSVANYENGRAPLSVRIKKWIAAQEKRS